MAAAVTTPLTPRPWMRAHATRPLIRPVMPTPATPRAIKPSTEAMCGFLLEDKRGDQNTDVQGLYTRQGCGWRDQVSGAVGAGAERRGGRFTHRLCRVR